MFLFRPAVLFTIVAALAAVAALSIAVPRVIDSLHLGETPSSSQPAQQHVRPLAEVKPATLKVPVQRWDRPANMARLAGSILLVGGALLVVLQLTMSAHRLAERERRVYALYDLRLSLHDQARREDVLNMIETILGAVREFPERRMSHGQGSFAFDLLYGPGTNGMQWGIYVWCEPRMVAAFDGAISAAYPDTRLGFEFEGPPRPVPNTITGPGADMSRRAITRPGHVLRYRKAREFLYSLSSDQDTESTPPLEMIGRMQDQKRYPSGVRLVFTPAPHFFEAWARRRFTRHENRLTRSQTWGLDEAGTRSVLNEDEMRTALRTQNHGLLWMDIQIVASTRDEANAVAAPVIAPRSENRLHRRFMFLRQKLYCDRYVRFYPPLYPSVGWGQWPSLTSTAEIAYLLELPSARMHSVPVRRATVPRIAVPPTLAPCSPATEIPECGTSQFSDEQIQEWLTDPAVAEAYRDFHGITTTPEDLA